MSGWHGFGSSSGYMSFAENKIMYNEADGFFTELHPML